MEREPNLHNPHMTHEPAPPIDDLNGAFGVVDRLRARLRAAVKGRDDVIELIIVALLADGHVLLEDYPGSGKTTLAKALGDSIVDDMPDDDIVAFRRIQFTPDLLPSDVTGSTIFDPTNNRFFFRPGPVFSHVVLADEINRTSPKVQSALLEAMGEKQVTVDNLTRVLDGLFFVIATQNPLDLQGTFPLPSAQLDRFLFKIRMEHIAREAELEVLRTRRARADGDGDQDRPRVSRTEVLHARSAVDRLVHVADAIHDALVLVAERSRTQERVMQGISTRALVLSVPALQARALSQTRDFVNAEDLEFLAPYIFSHRLELGAPSEQTQSIVQDCLRPALESLARVTLHRI